MTSFRVLKPIAKRTGQKTLDGIFKVVKKEPSVLSKNLKSDQKEFKALNIQEDPWYIGLSDDVKQLLDLELKYIAPQWLEIVKTELTKPYFLELKRFLAQQKLNKVTIFPPEHQIYSFTTYCPDVSKIKVLILGQDPYHNVGQAHGLAFSVLCPKIPPLLINIYKAVRIDYPEFVAPKKNGNLEKWAQQGVLLLNTCLTVEAHKANSHNKKGWEQFTSAMIKGILDHKNKRGEEVIVLAWGAFAINLMRKTINLDAINKKNGVQNKILTSVHPSPLSASRGFFDGHHFKKCNDWIKATYGEGHEIDWTCIKDN